MYLCMVGASLQAGRLFDTPPNYIFAVIDFSG